MKNFPFLSGQQSMRLLSSRSYAAACSSSANPRAGRRAEVRLA